MKLSNVFLILVQFTLYYTNKIYKNILQKLVRFIQTGELFLAFFICFVHYSKLLKSPRGALVKKPWRWKTNDWVNTIADTKLNKDFFVITRISLMFHRALNRKDENTSCLYWFNTILIWGGYENLMETKKSRAFHYARASGQSPVGMPEENGTTFSDQTGPSKRNGCYPFFPFLNSLHKRRDVEQWTGLSKWNRKSWLEYSGWKELKRTFPFDFRPKFL